MSTYATVDEYVAVYSLAGVTSQDINDVWLPSAGNELESRLGAYFTLPFSGNESAKWLNIHLARAQQLRRTLKTDDSLELDKRIDQQITQIASGNAPMILTDGAALFSNQGGNQGFWSNTEDYKSVFDMRGSEKQRVDPDYLDQLDNEDNL